MRSPCTATKSSPRSPQLEKARTQQRRPNAAKNKKTKTKNSIFHAASLPPQWVRPGTDLIDKSQAPICLALADPARLTNESWLRSLVSVAENGTLRPSFLGWAPPLPWLFLLSDKPVHKDQDLVFIFSCRWTLKATEIQLNWITLMPSRWFCCVIKLKEHC